MTIPDLQIQEGFKDKTSKLGMTLPQTSTPETLQ